jgi:hypothetical protein
MGQKVSDEFTVPLCRGHHREVHRYVDESVMVETGGNRPSHDSRRTVAAVTPACSFKRFRSDGRSAKPRIGRPESRSVIVVLDPLYVVFAEIASGLHFDEFEINLARIFQPVL